MRRGRWFWCYCRHELWCCFIFELVCYYIMKIRGTLITTASFRRWTLLTGMDKLANIHLLPKRKPLGCYMIGWKYQAHHDTSAIIGWIVCGRVQWISSARRVTHRSTIMSSGGINLDFPWNMGWNLGFKPPFRIQDHVSRKHGWHISWRSFLDVD